MTTVDRTYEIPSFSVMGSRRSVPLKTYVRKYLSEHPDCQIYVGSDSQNVGPHTIYATTIVFRHYESGAHVLYTKERVPKIPDLWSKLWGETERSARLSEWLRSDCEVPIYQVELDFNSDPEYESYKLLSASRGYIQSLGFKCAAKPDLLIAAWAANVLCQS